MVSTGPAGGRGPAPVSHLALQPVDTHTLDQSMDATHWRNSPWSVKILSPSSPTGKGSVGAQYVPSLTPLSLPLLYHLPRMRLPRLRAQCQEKPFCPPTCAFLSLFTHGLKTMGDSLSRAEHITLSVNAGRLRSRANGQQSWGYPGNLSITFRALTLIENISGKRG